MIRRIIMCRMALIQSDPYQPATRVKGFKQMVQALHRAGIRVIMDMVYNHTFNTVEVILNVLFPVIFIVRKKTGHWQMVPDAVMRRQVNAL